MFQLSWCVENDKSGGCFVKCSAFTDDDIGNDVECVNRILKKEGFGAWGKKNHCHSTSIEIINQCFRDVLDLDKFITSENKTEKIEDESTLSDKGTLVVELVNFMVDSVKSFDAGATSSKFSGRNQLTVNNYIMFNITGNEVRKIKIKNFN